MAAPKDRDPITTHVLDTTTGLPAKGVNVILSVEGSDKKDFSAETNSDGRITNWKDRTGVTVPTVTNSHDGKMVWRLSYKVEEYYGEGKTFFPQVDLQFIMPPKPEGGARPHIHVPLLLGPWSYTTYRGS